MENDQNKGIKRVFGIVLLVFGIAVCIFVLSVIYNLLTGGSYVMFVRSLVPEELSSAATGDNSTLVVIVGQALVVFGYLIVVFLLSVAIRMANGLLRTGANLLTSDLALLAEKLRNELIKWRQEE